MNEFIARRTNLEQNMSMNSQSFKYNWHLIILEKTNSLGVKTSRPNTHSHDSLKRINEPEDGDGLKNCKKQEFSFYITKVSIIIVK